MDTFNFRELATLLVDRALYAGKHGLQFGGLRDLYKALGYDREITPELFRERFNRGDIASRIVKAYPEATWGEGFSVVEDPDPGVITDFENDFISLSQRVNLESRLLQADILAGLGEFSILVIGMPGLMSSPVTRITPDSVLYLKPVSQQNCKIIKSVKNPSDERFGRPEIYRINIGTGETDSVSVISKEIHWTRVLHISEGNLDNDVLGEPRLRSIWNRLNDLDKIVGGGSEAFWKNVSKVRQFNIDPKLKIKQSDREAFKKQIEELEHNLRTNLTTVGVDLKEFGSSVPPFKSHIDAVLMIISAATGIPMRILTGSERGELASSQDRSNWNDRSGYRRMKYATPIVREFIDKVFPSRPSEYSTVWPTSEELTEKEKAEVVAILARANKDQNLANGEVVMTSNEIRDLIMGLDPLGEVDSTLASSRITRLTLAKYRLRKASTKGYSRAIIRSALDSEHEISSIVQSSWKKAVTSLDVGLLAKAIEDGDESRVMDMVDEALLESRSFLENS